MKSLADIQKNKNLRWSLKKEGEFHGRRKECPSV